MAGAFLEQQLDHVGVPLRGRHDEHRGFVAVTSLQVGALQQQKLECFDAPGNGCVVAALGTDIARQPRRVRQVFTKQIKTDLEFLSRLMPDDSRRPYEDAIVAFASMIGALILARAVSDDELSDLILKSTAKRVIKRAKVRKTVRSS